MNKNWPTSLQWVLQDEGGYSHNSHDPGGVTNCGIIQAEYSKYRTARGLHQQSVFYITQAEYEDIYRHNYWEPWCDRLQSGVDYIYFDMCVNMGPRRATHLLQLALTHFDTTLRDDGIMGPKTMSVANSHDAKAIVETLKDVRLQFYRALHIYKYFGKGWNARVLHSTNRALTLLPDNPAHA